MCTLDVVVYRLTYVVQKRGPSRNLHVRTELGGHHAAKVCNLDRVRVNVLAVGGAILQRAQEPQEVAVHPTGDLGIVQGLPSSVLYLLFDVLASLGDDLLDPPRMYASILHQPLHGYAPDLAPHRIKARYNYRLGCIINNDIYTRGRLESPDVPPLAPDNAPLHVVRGQRHRLYGRLSGYVRGQPLHRGRRDAARLHIRPLLCLQGPVAHHTPEPVPQLDLEVVIQPAL